MGEFAAAGDEREAAGNSAGFDVAAEQVLVEALQGLDRDARAADGDSGCSIGVHASNLVFLLALMLVSKAVRCAVRRVRGA